MFLFFLNVNFKENLVNLYENNFICDSISELQWEIRYSRNINNAKQGVHSINSIFPNVKSLGLKLKMMKMKIEVNSLI
jgi:hypothetical protein